MKMKLLILRNFILVLITGIILSACTKKDDTTSNKADLVGTWTMGTPTVTVMIGTKTLLQYLTSVAGLSASEAATFNTAFNQAILESFTGDTGGTITIKSDGTYTANIGDEPDSGTWSLSADGKKLTIDSDDGDLMIFDLVELTSSKLSIKMTETQMEDLNNDSILEAITVSIVMNFTR
jgi:hypothetical protein